MGLACETEMRTINDVPVARMFFPDAAQFNQCS